VDVGRWRQLAAWAARVGGPDVFDGSRVVIVAAGECHSAATTEDGALWTWGEGDNGRLGHGDDEARKVYYCLMIDKIRNRKNTLSKSRLMLTMRCLVPGTALLMRMYHLTYTCCKFTTSCV
jgi:hypothetical protein